MQAAQSQESEVQTLLNSFVGISTTTIFIMTMHSMDPTVQIDHLWYLALSTLFVMVLN